MKLCIFIAIFLLTSIPFDVKPSNGHDLLRDCTAAIDVIDKGKKVLNPTHEDATRCLVFIKGVVQATQLQNNVYHEKSLFCPPKEITPIQATRVVVKYLKTHPELSNENDLLLVASGMRNEFPCDNENP